MGKISSLETTNDDEDFNPKKAVKKAIKAEKAKINSFYSDDEDFAFHGFASKNEAKKSTKKSSKIDSDSDDDEDFNVKPKSASTKKKKSEPKKKLKSLKLDSDSDSDFSPSVKTK